MENIISFPKIGIQFKINRVAFNLFGLDVYWYGIIICFGTILAIIYGLNELEKKNFSVDDITSMILIGAPVSVVCARFYYVAFKFEDFKNCSFFELINIRQGGIAIYGAIIGALITGFIYTKIKKIPILPILDAFGVCLLIGQSIGRWGNFVNAEAYGSHTNLPWAMSILGSVNEYMVHPTFLYESVWSALGILFLKLYKKNAKFQGEIFLAYMIWYGSARFFIEGLRKDSLMFYSIRISKFLSLLMVMLSSTIIYLKRKKLKNT